MPSPKFALQATGAGLTAGVYGFHEDPPDITISDAGATFPIGARAIVSAFAAEALDAAPFTQSPSLKLLTLRLFFEFVNSMADPSTALLRMTEDAHRSVAAAINFLPLIPMSVRWA